MTKKMIIILLSCLLVITVFGFTVQAQKLKEAYDVDMPEKFGEAPEFKELVEAGELPPVEERLPEDPLVVDPIDEIGEYGGTAYTAILTLSDMGDDTNLMDVNSNFVRPNVDGSAIYLNFARDIEMSDNMDVFTIYLRKGVKWSDGEPFTTEDIKFWYEDILQNKELTPAYGTHWLDAKGELMELNVIDDFTFEIKFGSTKPFFIEALIHQTASMLYPKHYSKQFHPQYAEEDELKAKVKERGFDVWYELFQHVHDGWAQQSWYVGTPTLASYVLTKKDSSRRVYERNPYYWKVDSAGNQLPYIKRIEADLVSNAEVYSGRIMAGQIDFAGRNTDIRNYPMYRNYEDRGNYKTLQWIEGWSSDAVFMFNHTHEDQNMREIFQNTQFKRAMSIAINRQEINEMVYFGQGEPVQYTVLPGSQYYKEEYAKAYIEYNPEKAKRMLDEIGLTDQNGDGWRQLPNGNNFQMTVELVPIAPTWEANLELVMEYWKEIGINVNLEQISGELAHQRAPGNMMDANVWAGHNATDVLFPNNPHLVVPMSPGWENTIWPLWGRWLTTDGRKGEEPPQKIKELREWWEDMQAEPDQTRRVELAHNILERQAENLWCIGTVGQFPHIVIANNNLRNLPDPDKAVWVWDLLWNTTNDPEQIYFKGGQRAE